MAYARHAYQTSRGPASLPSSPVLADLMTQWHRKQLDSPNAKTIATLTMATTTLRDMLCRSRVDPDVEYCKSFVTTNFVDLLLFLAGDCTDLYECGKDARVYMPLGAPAVTASMPIRHVTYDHMSWEHGDFVVVSVVASLAHDQHVPAIDRYGRVVLAAVTDHTFG